MVPTTYIFRGGVGAMIVRLRIPNPEVDDPNLADGTLVGLPDILRVTHAKPTARNPNEHERKRIIDDEVRRVTRNGWLRLYGDRGVAGDHGCCRSLCFTGFCQNNPRQLAQTAPPSAILTSAVGQEPT